MKKQAITPDLFAAENEIIQANCSFEQLDRVRRKWDKTIREYRFSVVDVVGVLTESQNPKVYLSWLKKELKESGSQLFNNTKQLKFKAADSKMRATETMTREQLLRLIQSVPSPKAEPVKLWLANIGEKALQQAEAQDRHGKIRNKSKDVRVRLQDERARCGIQGAQHGGLTNITYRKVADKDKNQWLAHKGLNKTANLRDNMTDIELTLITLAELNTIELSQVENPSTYIENANVTEKGAVPARIARDAMEKQRGTSVISHDNAKTRRIA